MNGTDTPPSLPLPQPEYYSLIFRIVGTVLVSIIFVVGCIGNLMVIVVVARCKSMYTPTNCYLVSLAAADVLFLLFAAVPTLVEYHLMIDEYIMGTYGCSIMVFTQYLGVNVSSISITSLTIERYIAICHPMRAQSICTVSRAKRIIAGVWTFGVIYSAPWLALATTVPVHFADGSTVQRCTFKLPRDQYTSYYLADFIIFYATPLIVNSVLYGLIGSALYTNTVRSTGGRTPPGSSGVVTAVSDWHSTGYVMVGRRDQLSDGCGHVTNGRGQHVTAALIRAQPGAARGVSGRIQVIKMLAVVVGLFAVLWLPYRLHVVYNSFARKRLQNVWLMLVCRLMVYLNSAINPILYNLMSIKFRRAFGRLLACGRVDNPLSAVTGRPPRHQSPHTAPPDLGGLDTLAQFRDTTMFA